MKPPTKYFSTDPMVWLAVRCCCTPSKVMGFLQVHASDARRDEFTLGRHRISIRRSYKAHINSAEDTTTYQAERAVYSEDRPIEFWRRVPSFIEASKP